ncbi:LysR family transcriptional regulator [Curvivirga sp.]|uniref:LysR family transcriptional regulator n=1 Tax=Curvivirga sp. TaxID=2856848 RepID=UPI003B58CCA7
MDRLTAAKVFICVVEQGSFIAASDIMNVSRAQTSRYVTLLEDWTRSKLLHRTTRRLSLTPAGEKMLDYCHRLVSLSEEIGEVAGDPGDLPSGVIRIGASKFFIEHYLMDVVDRYLKHYPDVKIELVISNEIVDLVKDRIDLAIRISNNLDPNLIARKLGKVESVLCVSPAYLEDYKKPMHLTDLTNHNCLVYSNLDQTVWRFLHQQQSKSVNVKGNLASNEADTLLLAALKGIGIAYLPSKTAQPYIQNGELIELLPNFTPEPIDIHGVFLSRKNMPIALRYFIDMIVVDMTR